MSPKNRAKFDRLVASAKAGDEDAITELRVININLCSIAPVSALVRMTEALNDAYVDEQIEWAEAQGATDVPS